jgi:hypothetical protein
MINFYHSWAPTVGLHVFRIVLRNKKVLEGAIIVAICVQEGTGRQSHRDRIHCNFLFRQEFTERLSTSLRYY